MKRVKRSFLILFLLLGCALIWIPMWIIISGSFMGISELQEHVLPILNEVGFTHWPILPLFPTMKPYIELLIDTGEFYYAFWNTCFITFPTLAGQMIVAAPAAWALSCYKGKLKIFILTVYIVLMILPFQVTMVSNYLALDNLNLLNSRLAIILPTIFSPFPVFIMFRFFMSIPTSIIEAGQIDGASPLKLFFHIGIPLGTPGIMAAFILDFLDLWNLIEQPMVFLKDKSLWPLSLYLPAVSLSQLGTIFVSSLTVMIPAILVFLCGQKYLETGISAAGFKE